MTSTDYNELDSILISENFRSGGLNLENFNRAIGMLVQRDISLIPEMQTAPGIYERTWMNDPQIKKYGIGDAVWINTEDPVDFVNNRKNDILEYIFKNTILNDRYVAISSDDAIRNNFIYEVALSGYDAIPPIYYIGDLTAHAQIRISLSDDNDTFPYDDSHWKNFFETQSKERISSEMTAFLDSTYDTALQSHIQSYHLSSSAGKLSSQAQLSSKYVDKYLSNIDQLSAQVFKSHTYHPDVMDGFDSVKCFISKRDSALQCVKWFRLWTSGFLEHGGIVNAANPSAMGDTLEYDRTCYRVNLAWAYGSNKTSPTYDFPETGLQPFFTNGSKLQFAGHASQYHGNGNIAKQSRYTIHVSPIRSTAYPAVVSETAMSADNCYLVNEVNTVNNDSFCIVLNPKDLFLSYYCTGFTNSKAKQVF